MLTKLEVVNACLRTLGQGPIQSLEDGERNFYANAALQILTGVDKDEQRKGWWFNKECHQYEPEPGTGEIRLPSRTLWGRVFPRGEPINLRGLRLYDGSTGSYEIGRPVVVETIQQWEWDDLPHSFQEVVSTETQLRFTETYDADTLRLEQIMRRRQEAGRALSADHMSQVRNNLLETPEALYRRLRRRYPIDPVSPGRLRTDK